MSLPSIDEIRVQLPRIRSLKELKIGGQKIVFDAAHEDYGRVVLKLIRNPMSDARAIREIEVATDYSFANVPRLYEWGHIAHGSGETIYLVEQYVEGQTLTDYLSKNGPMPLPEGLQLLSSLLTTAVELEKQKLVHRDIKPDNIILGTDGTVWLLDFGIARHLEKTSLTATAGPWGPHTAGYAAPEQFRNLKVEIDIRTDLFAIGVVVYQALSGANPFIDGARDNSEIRWRTANQKPVPLTIPGDSQGELSGFIDMLMDTWPSRRPRTAEKALAYFQALLPTIVVE